MSNEQNTIRLLGDGKLSIIGVNCSGSDNYASIQEINNAASRIREMVSIGMVTHGVLRDKTGQHWNEAMHLTEIEPKAKSDPAEFMRSVHQLDHEMTDEELKEELRIDLNGYEKAVVKYNGYIIDLFKTESGSLGMTVEVGAEISPEAPSVDIFVDKNLKVISA